MEIKYNSNIFYKLNILLILKFKKKQPKRSDYNDFLKFICQSKSRKNIQLPRFSSLVI